MSIDDEQHPFRKGCISQAELKSFREFRKAETVFQAVMTNMNHPLWQNHAAYDAMLDRFYSLMERIIIINDNNRILL